MSLKEQASFVEKEISIFDLSNRALIGKVLISFDMNIKPSDGAKVTVKGMIDGVYDGGDFYDAFLALRKMLEDENRAVLGCKGCLKQVHLSGLSRDWSNGLTGYFTDEETLDNESVFIFDEVGLEQVNDLMTIKDQRSYRENFRRENKDRYIERNQAAEEAAKAREEKAVKDGNSWRSK